MSVLSRLAPLLLEERDPARVSQIVRRVSGAYGVAATVWAFVAGFALDLPIQAMVGAVAAIGLLGLALAARRWPYASGAGLVGWIWAIAVQSQIRQGTLAPAGIYLTAIVAAGLLLGGRAAVLISALTALTTGAILLGLESGVLVPTGPTLTSIGTWTLSVACFAAIPVLLAEALGRLRRALNQARDAERRYRLVAENAHDLIILIEDGVLRYVSPASERVLGWTPEEALARGARFQYLTPDSAQYVRTVVAREIARGASHVRYDVEVLRKDGSTAWCELDATVLRHADGRVHGTLAVARDISERRQVEADRERIHGELIQAQKMEIVGRISAGVAHDLNNQLTLILGAAEGLADGWPDSRVDAEKTITHAARSAAGLTRQLQTFSRRHTALRAPFDLAVLVQRLEGTLRRVLGPSIETIVSPSSGPAVVLADEAQVEQAILNLALNARDAMPSGGRLTLELAAGAGERADLWLLRVVDTGTGIDETTRARLFEPFFTTKPPGLGTGLGLPMARRVAEEAGGSVTFESEVGRGTTFEFALPQHHGPVEPETSPATGPAASAGETILVLDDAPEVLALLTRALRREGYRVLEASSPARALALVGRQRLDLVVSDIVMPGMRGPELVKQLRRERPRLPALYVSGYASEEPDVTSDPLATLLWKPVSMRKLRSAVRQALDASSQAAADADATLPGAQR